MLPLAEVALRALDLITHVLHAQTAYSVHSPFVYQFYQHVLRGPSSETGERIERLRRQLSRSRERITFRDHGAGAGEQGSRMVSHPLGHIAQHAARSRREGEFLHRLCKHYQPRHSLELGTNLGISTLYQATALPPNSLISLEGAASLAKLAQQHLQRFSVSADVRVGEFSQLLDQIDWQAFRPEYVLLDGNHRKEPTLQYFHRLLPHMAPGGLMVFDDIYWSAGMRAAWQEIQQHPAVSVSIDLFSFGLCFIRRPQAKQHFRFLLL